MARSRDAKVTCGCVRSRPNRSTNWSRRWCGPSGRMELINRTAHAQQVRLEMTLAADYGGNLTIQGLFFSEQMKIDRNGQRLEKTFSVPPGEHAIFLTCDARRVFPPNDF